ncbi:MAG: flagellar protein FlgN [Burkholderiaceae bacterium]|jgi:flagella synthesis protein FlgN|nr:flagellar protein FlgN [Burkholderiaceae bacterium]
MKATQTAMTSSLNQEIATARALVDILQEEQNSLLTASIGELEPLVTQKAALVAQLSQHTRDRNESLKKAGYEPTLAGMNAWLESSRNEPETIRIEKDWGELVLLTQSARELNRLNGMLISSHMARNQQALSILHGNKPDTGIYGPDGQPNRAPATPLRSVVTS